MTCVHLRKLYQLCQDEGVKLAGADLIHLVCPQCGEREVCPSVLLDEYEADERRRDQDAKNPSAPHSAAGNTAANSNFSA